VRMFIMLFRVAYSSHILYVLIWYGIIHNTNI